jgi:curved DNA-binding protein
MIARSPYSILGISESATRRDIRDAYRGLALRHHPDAGGGDTGAFFEVRQAYEVLRDPSARREWDDAHAPYSQRRHVTRFTSQRIDPVAASYSEARQARALAPDMAIAPPALAPLFDTFFDAFDLLDAGFLHEGPAAEAERLFFDLELTREEVARGGRFSFAIPLRHRDGELLEPELHVLVPPGAHDGQRATLPLEHLGVRGQVTVTLRVV